MIALTEFSSSHVASRKNMPNRHMTRRESVTVISRRASTIDTFDLDHIICIYWRTYLGVKQYVLQQRTRPLGSG